jgi:hypothetical protein
MLSLCTYTEHKQYDNLVFSYALFIMHFTISAVCYRLTLLTARIRFQEWMDEKLQWDPSNYGGVGVFHVHTSEIWVPEIAQFGL